MTAHRIAVVIVLLIFIADYFHLGAYVKSLLFGITPYAGACGSRTWFEVAEKAAYLIAIYFFLRLFLSTPENRNEELS